jgi:hypothetical protein
MKIQAKQIPRQKVETAKAFFSSMAAMPTMKLYILGQKQILIIRPIHSYSARREQ